MSTVAFPPQKSQASVPISQATALTHIQAYLTLTKTTPYLLPNAKLEASGPTAGSSANNVTIINLERVEAGLRGEWLAPAFNLEEEEVAVVAAGNDEVEVDGWQDKDEFEREQSDVEGEITGDATVISQADAAGKEKTLKRKYAGEEGGVVDKEARKAEKKLRLKEEKKQKAEMLRLKKEAEE